MLKNYRLGFDFWGLALFIVVMIPSFIWAVNPAPNDVLRAESETGIIDTTASVCQVIMAAALCMVINKDRRKIALSPMIIAAAACCILYFTGWILYYNSIVNPIVILSLTLPPCLAFLFFAIDRKNIIALIPAVIFTVCHLIFGVVNFIL